MKNTHSHVDKDCISSTLNTLRERSHPFPSIEQSNTLKARISTVYMNHNPIYCLLERMIEILRLLIGVLEWLSNKYFSKTTTSI